ncbi:hypothetical protein BJ170DRAFT_597993 [Xylariales sp. AK1849]|nr:hypothetical protein BJ170DRAFT_597993 [Xylariales sp. AK1849]
MAAAGLVDPTKVGRYPVILSDALLGKKSSEVYTGVRYNHNPDTPPPLAKVKQSASSKSTYDLTFQDGGIHRYRGTRAGEDGKYVLIFDPAREAFILHRVDSTFNMNLISTPENKDADSLRQNYPHLKNTGTASGKAKGSTAQGAKGNKAKAQEKEQPKPRPLPKKRDAKSDEEEDSDDDDGGLVVEFPGGREPGSNRDFSPAFPPRRFSEFVAHADEEEDADGEDDDMSEEEYFKLPSPMNFQTTSTPAATQQSNAQPQSQPMQADESESEEDEEFETVSAPAPMPVQQQEDEDDDMDVDLEAALEAELEADQSESDVSEED